MAPIEIDDQLQRRKITLSDDNRNTLLAETGGFLQSLGHWTDRHLGTKRNSSGVQEVYPHFEPIHNSARALLAGLVAYMQPDDTFDVGVLSDCCRGQDPGRVFDWLMLTGLAEPVVRESENLRLTGYSGRRQFPRLLNPRDEPRPARVVLARPNRVRSCGHANRKR